jgi:hypothetical protein
MRQWAASYSANRDAIGLPSWRSSFLGDAGANFFCTGHDVLEMLPPPQSALRPKRVTLWATQGFAPTGAAGADHHEVGPNEKIKRGQIKLTESNSSTSHKVTRMSRADVLRRDEGDRLGIVLVRFSKQI